MNNKQLKVSVVGTGYVGLGTAVLLAYLGYQVTGLDVDAEKVRVLQNGDIPIHEPGLAELMRQSAGNLRWTTDYAEAIPDADVIFICVGTPPLPDGRPDLKYVARAAESIARHMGDNSPVVVNKSTVPVGTGDWVTRIIEEHLPKGVQRQFTVVSNPEFLREGSALFDSLYPDRLVLGGDRPEGTKRLMELYTPLIEQKFTAPDGVPRPDKYVAPEVVVTSLTSAEMIKYAANAFLALKISFANEIAGLCERVDADVLQVVRGIGSDHRIGRHFLAAGTGWGGSCFGKDTSALISTGEEYGYDMPILQAAIDVNTRQRQLAISKLQRHLHRLKGKRIAILGMAFKPHTDDLRDAPAYDCISRLADMGATVVAHDPIAMKRASLEWSHLNYQAAQSAEEALNGADAAIIVTEWPEYARIDWAKQVGQMRSPLIIDMRNMITQPVEGAVIEQVGRRSQHNAAGVTV